MENTEFKKENSKWLLNDTNNEIFGGVDNYNMITGGVGYYDKYSDKQDGFCLSGYISKENALLISKAPEMLEMLTELTELKSSSFILDELKERAKQLIKEATNI